MTVPNENAVWPRANVFSANMHARFPTLLRSLSEEAMAMCARERTSGPDEVSRWSDFSGGLSFVTVM